MLYNGCWPIQVAFHSPCPLGVVFFEFKTVNGFE